MSGDERRQVEIDVGAVLNALEPLEFELDDLLAKVMTNDVPQRLVTDLTWARHYTYQARICVARVFEQIEKHSSHYLRSRRSLDDAHGELKTARHRAEDVKRHLTECSNSIRAIASEGDKQWEHNDQWINVLKSSTAATAAIENAIPSIIAARLTAGDDYA